MMMLPVHACIRRGHGDRILKDHQHFPATISITGIPSSPAQVLLIDGKTGIVIAVLDGTYVTQLRTGAASGAAFDVLAKKDCRIGALIGTGGQAATQLEAMIAARKLEEVRVYDLNFERTKDFAARMQEEGIYVTGFYYPVVPKDQARIRVQISAGHEKEQPR